MNVVEVDAITKPAWVDALLGDNATRAELFSVDGLEGQITDAGKLCHLQLVVPDAVALDSRQLQQRVVQVYDAVRTHLTQRGTCHPLRFWNYIPDIHGVGHDGMGHYEVFNAGRFEAFSDWYGTRQFGSRMVAASGVGHRGRDFVVQVLAAEHPGRGVENPRQRPAYRYSHRYGPMPPCFARATLAPNLNGDPDRRLMIVAGTASIVGEDSFHRDHLAHQLRETCKNLASLIGTLGPGKGQPQDPLSQDPLSCFRELRVYLVDSESRGKLIELLAGHFPRLERLELMPADLCRQSLLVEIESMVEVEKGI